ncbi:hypothetical protein PR002_g21613 [Phytophthora rubi]|uniref:PLAC8 family protein n=1 Tax=Phytophthora rubi TaxID=129364 RepID=A0A6A3J0Y5_9STRA|nr:hypothetical protein PR002_g21613 [Phytophthora rubi]
MGLETDAPYAIRVEDEPTSKDDLGITVGKWEVGFCGCCTHCVPNCLMVTCCPCISLAQISARLGMMQYDLALVLFILLFVFTGGIGGIVGAIWLCQARTQTRERYQIPGSCCGDYCAACCCGCCAMAQLATHIKSYQPGTCDFGAQATLPALNSIQTKNRQIEPALKMADLEKPYTIAVEEPKADQAGEFTTGKWEVGFCDCCTHCVPNCLMVTCCPCITLAQISARLDMLAFKWALLLSILMLIIPSVGSIVFVIWIWMARIEVRERFKIPGGCCGDCMASICCACCALAQMATHIKSYKPGSCAFGPQDTLAPYQRA